MSRKLILIITVFIFTGGYSLKAQTKQLSTSQQFRIAERFIRIAEPGELADSVNVWGDVGSSGRYLIPKGTDLARLISYSFGPRTLSDSQTQIDWSKMRVEINVQEYDNEEGGVAITKFKYRFEDPYPEGMKDFVLKNNHIIAVRVKRKPSFRDYLGVFASTVSAVASTIILLDRLGGK
ncbi:hypothetical protein [Gelidibacter japonicus]|uniref:hypothetical protein n=1 Tax=Gelidibacter japonicus TaxID=1962232 RepID=UPI003A8F4116